MPSVAEPLHTAPELGAAREALHRIFGFEDFRGSQSDVVARVLRGQSTLAVMPTGAGKSLTYQLPATMVEGTCVVISVGSSRVDLQACKLEYSIVSPK